MVVHNPVGATAVPISPAAVLPVDFAARAAALPSMFSAPAAAMLAAVVARAAAAQQNVAEVVHDQPGGERS
jgi:hypothetical protein